MVPAPARTTNAPNPAWERLPDPKHPFSLEVISPDREPAFVNLGPHPPRLWPEDVERLHDIWLKLSTADQMGSKLHHRDIEAPSYLVKNGLPAWSADGMSVFYTAKVGKGVELFRVTLDGKAERLTHTPDGSLHYHPQPSSDGRWLAFGSLRDRARNLYVMNLTDRTLQASLAAKIAGPVKS